MRLSNGKKRFIMPVLTIALIAGLAGTLTGCEEFGQFPSSTTTAAKTTEATSAAFFNTKDGVILAVQERLLSEAESYEAKMYLAEFYTASDNWSAQAEVFKDGSGIWQVTVDMSKSQTWTARSYWQQASWFVSKEGKVSPSNRFQANALRIEADLQELSNRAKQ